MCFITACTMAAVKCTTHSVHSAETDEVSNIVVMIVFSGGGLAGENWIMEVVASSFSLANSQSYF